MTKKTPRLYSILECALCRVKLNSVAYQIHVYTLAFERMMNEIQRNEQKFRFS